MKFLCGSCRTKYQISDERVRGKILTIRCQKCHAKIQVREPIALVPGALYIAEVAGEAVAERIADRVALGGRPGSRPVVRGASEVEVDSEDEAPTRVMITASDRGVPTTSAMPAVVEVEWFSATDGKQKGPFTLAEIGRQVTTKELLPTHYVWNQQQDGWKRVRDVPDLAACIPPPAGEHVPGVPTQEEREIGEIVNLAEKRRERRKRPEGAAISERVETPAVELLSSDLEAPKPGDTIPMPRARSHTPAPESGIPVIAAPTPIPTKSSLAFAEVTGGTPRKGISTDDLFADLPRLPQETLGAGKESTRHFIAAAGVNEKKSRAKLAVIVGSVAAVAFACFISAWALGVIDVPVPQAVNPFKFAKIAQNDELGEVDDIDDGEVEEATKHLSPEERRNYRRKRVKKRDHALLAEPRAVNDTATRSGEPLVTLKFDPLTGERKVSTELPPSKLPIESDPSRMMPPVDMQKIDDASINRVITSKKSSLSLCYSDALRRRETTRGRVSFRVIVRPTGDVSAVTISSRTFKASGLAQCIADRMRDWKFPQFAGRESAEFEVPFVLEQGI